MNGGFIVPVQCTVVPLRLWRARACCSAARRSSRFVQGAAVGNFSSSRLKTGPAGSPQRFSYALIIHPLLQHEGDPRLERLRRIRGVSQERKGDLHSPRVASGRGCRRRRVCHLPISMRRAQLLCSGRRRVHSRLGCCARRPLVLVLCPHRSLGSAGLEARGGRGVRRGCSLCLTLTHHMRIASLKACLTPRLHRVRGRLGLAALGRLVFSLLCLLPCDESPRLRVKISLL